MNVCQGCGTELPPSKTKPRKWCSARCRKAQYGGACVDCGGKTNGGNGASNRPTRCLACHITKHTAERKASARRREAEVAELYCAGVLPWQIAERLGLTAAAVKTLAMRARQHGLDVPYAPTGRPAHRDQVAA